LVQDPGCTAVTVWSSADDSVTAKQHDGVFPVQNGLVTIRLKHFSLHWAHETNNVYFNAIRESDEKLRTVEARFYVEGTEPAHKV
jgi:hypothetical protein